MLHDVMRKTRTKFCFKLKLKRVLAKLPI